MPGQAFRTLSQFGINFRLLGRVGYDAVVEVAKSCPIFRLTYADAVDAERLLAETSESFLELGSSVVSKTTVRLRRESVDAACEHSVSTDDTTPGAGANAGMVLTRTENPTRRLQTVRKVLNMVLSMLSNPARCNDLTVQQWDRVFPFANHIQLLPQLAARIRETYHWNRIPESVRSRLESECLMSRLRSLR